jgi:O-succinylbenzoic acid--CoA ligase
MTSPQTFRWIGRWDNVINTGGIKVIPEVLEGKLARIFSRLNIHRRYFIAGRPDPALGSHVALIIEGDPLTPEAVEMLQKEIVNILLKFENPRQILFVKRFHDTSSGKINRMETLNQL